MYITDNMEVTNSKYEIGEVVVCVDANRKWYKLGGLKENQMYTIEGFNPYDDGLILKEVKSPKSGYHAYRADRFRKVDYNFASDVLNSIRTEQRVDKVEAVDTLFQLFSKRFTQLLFN